MIALFSVSRIYMPGTLNRSIAQFGPLGSVFTLLSWIIVVCVAISVAIASGYVLAHEQPFARLLGTDAQSSEPPQDA
jgi:membrane protein